MRAPGDPTRRFGLNLAAVPSWAAGLAVAGLLAGAWALVYATGGTRTALPHVFYVPILAAALPFGVWGGLAAGIAATVLCGPAMPLDVATGEPQPLANWLTRGGFFTTIGVLTGTSTWPLRRSFTAGLARQFMAELTAAAPTVDDHDDDVWGHRIRQVLADRRLRPVFQPIYRLDDGRLLAVEALTRFDTSPTHPPNVWFEQATRIGLGVELELAAVSAALQASHDLPHDVALSVNASPGLLGDPRLDDLLDRHPGRQLVVEGIEDRADLDTWRALGATAGQGYLLARPAPLPAPAWCPAIADSSASPRLVRLATADR